MNAYKGKDNGNPIGHNKEKKFIINAGGTPSIQEACLSERPLPGIPGRLFLDTCLKRWYRDNGIRWVPLQAGPPGPKGPPGPPGPVGPGKPALTGIGAPQCIIGDPGDIYIDISRGCEYYKLPQPVPPNVREIPPPTGNTLHVGTGQTYTTLQAALAAAEDGDLLFLEAEVFNITDTVTVNKSVTIEGQGSSATSIIASSIATLPYYMFNVTVSDVVFRNMKIIQDYPRSAGETDTVLAFTNKTATGIYIDNCEIGISEIGIGIMAAEFQISNCSFIYAPNSLPNNKYTCILISNTIGESAIYNNTFTPGSQDQGCFFIRITNISAVNGALEGHLNVNSNTQTPTAFSLRHLLAIEEFIGSHFKLYINNNTTVMEGNVPVLLYNANMNIFKFIELIGNTMQNTAGKGLAGIDNVSMGVTDIFASMNTIANESFEAGWASATVPQSFVIGYRETIEPAPTLPLAVCYWLSIGGCS